MELQKLNHENNYHYSNPNIIVEKQLQNYTTLFQTIADQIGELNERVKNLQLAAE